MLQAQPGSVCSHPSLATPFPQDDGAILVQEGQGLASWPCCWSPSLGVSICSPKLQTDGILSCLMELTEVKSQDLGLAVDLGIAHMSPFIAPGSHS